MRATYTPKDGRPEAVEVVDIVVDRMLKSPGGRQRSAAESVVWLAFAAARLVDMLASRGILTCGDVLHVLDLSGTLELKDDL